MWPGACWGGVTVRQLLTHSAELPLRAALKASYGTDPQTICSGVPARGPVPPARAGRQYTDRAALILGYLAEDLSGQSLDELARTRVWEPLGMDGTRFGPLPQEVAARCAPTTAVPDPPPSPTTTRTAPRTRSWSTTAAAATTPPEPPKPTSPPRKPPPHRAASDPQEPPGVSCTAKPAPNSFRHTPPLCLPPVSPTPRLARSSAAAPSSSIQLEPDKWLC
ncbi:beta-lactamase family protein [Streptomyces sp. RKAG293]|nr:beta-lactamase family protein [Streptomyces sp. RKAG293]